MRSATNTKKAIASIFIDYSLGNTMRLDVGRGDLCRLELLPHLLRRRPCGILRQHLSVWATLIFWLWGAPILFRRFAPQRQDYDAWNWMARFLQLNTSVTRANAQFQVSRPADH